MNRADCANEILRGLGVVRPILSVGARRGLVAVSVAESGVEACDGEWGAAFNMLNTTLRMPGSTSFNSAGVQDYLDFAQGVEAVVSTLQFPAYDKLVAVLVNPKAVAQHVIDAWDKSPWGTHKPLLDQALARYQDNRAMFNHLEIG